jgi:hypothetical protein
MRGLDEAMDTTKRDGLVEIAGSEPPVFASEGVADRAAAIASIVADAYSYLSGLLGLRPPLQALVLTEPDWRSRTSQATYGLPHASDETLFVAGTEAPFWSQLAELIEPGDRPELVATYGEAGGRIPLGSFFDLVAVHEVAHLFHLRRPHFPRLWLQELFANLCLHAWVAERAPASLPILLTLPRLGARVPASRYAHTTRDDFERLYDDVGAANYAWYQFRLQLAAAALYERAGSDAVVRLFAAFDLDDTALARRLAKLVDPGLAEFSLAF